MSIARRLLRPFFVVHTALAATAVLYYAAREARTALLEGGAGGSGNGDLNVFMGIAIWIVVQTRASVSAEEALSRTFWVLRLASGVLLYMHDRRWLAPFVVVTLVAVIVLQPPAYNGETRAVPLASADDVEGAGVLRPGSQTVWVVQVASSKSYSSMYAAAMFADLSLKYHHDNLRFASVDAVEHPDIARLFDVRSESALPAYVVIAGGRIARRVPARDANGAEQPVVLARAKLLEALKLDDELAEAQRKLFAVPQAKPQAKRQ